MDTLSTGWSLNPTTQGKIHPLQRDNENFLGYFTAEFFEKINYHSKRQALDNTDGNPYVKLHPSLRPYPVFVDHNEALERYYQLRVGRGDPDAIKRLCEEFAKESRRRLLEKRASMIRGLNRNMSIVFFCILLAMIRFRGETADVAFLVALSLVTFGFFVFVLRVVKDIFEINRHPNENAKEE